MQVSTHDGNFCSFPRKHFLITNVVEVNCNATVNASKERKNEKIEKEEGEQYSTQSKICSHQPQETKKHPISARNIINTSTNSS